MQKIGLGRDLHRLVKGRPLVLGGVVIPAPKGEAGHSDGDALTHAVIDALLGAAGAGDIGELFPNTDGAYKNANSLELLRQAWQRIRQRGGAAIVNIDCVVSLEKPALLPYRPRVRESLAAALEIPVENIFVKAKTGEGLGDVGAFRAVEALAVVLLETES